MSLLGPSKSSTPIVGRAKGRALPRPGSSKSFSPVDDPRNRRARHKRITSSSPSDGTESKRRKLSRKQRKRYDGNSSWKTLSHRSTIGPGEMEPGGRMFDEELGEGREDEVSKDGPYVLCEKLDGRRGAIESLRDAPPPIANIESCIIDEPLFPRPQLGSPEFFDEDIFKDVPAYIEVPDLVSPARGIDDCILGTESDEDEEHHVIRPTKTYLGTIPRSTYKGPTYWRKIRSGKEPRKRPDSSLAEWQWYHKDEAERLWKKHCAAEAEERCRNLQSAVPSRKSIRNREIMLKIRAENAPSTPEETNAEPQGRSKRREPNLSPSPGLIIMHARSLGPANATYTEDNGDRTNPQFDDNPYDPASRVNRREKREAEREKRRRLTSICSGEMDRSSESSASSSSAVSRSGIIVRSNEPFIGPLWESNGQRGKKQSRTGRGN